MRLNAYLARAGMASRRGADKLIKDGRVRVNGQVGQLNLDVSEADLVELDGKKVELQSLRYILLYKPSGCVTTLKDDEGRRKVVDLINIPERVVPVGRLDFNTTGALLLTNDGELAHRLMHPSFEINKVYEATVEGQITDEKLKKLEQGIELEDLPTGKAGGKTAPAKIRQISPEGQSLQQGLSLLEVTIHEGRNHQVKRMLAAVGLTTKKLHRSKYGPFALAGLKPSQWRDLTPTEVTRLPIN